MNILKKLVNNSSAMKRITISAIAILSLSNSATAISSDIKCPQLNEKQIAVLKKSYELGEPHDLGYTLAAIALKESTAGSYIINAISSDYGVYQGNVETICKQAGVFHNPFQCNVEIQRVVNDIERASEHAIETLSYWKNYHTKRTENYLVYEKMIRSYNAGFGFDRATDYWLDYRKKFHTIKQCVELI